MTDEITPPGDGGNNNENTDLDYYIEAEYEELVYVGVKYTKPLTITGTVYTDENKSGTVDLTDVDISLVGIRDTISKTITLTKGNNGNFTITYTPSGTIGESLRVLIRNGNYVVYYPVMIIICNTHVELLHYLFDIRLYNHLDDKGVTLTGNESPLELIDKIKEIEGSVGGITIDTSVTCTPSTNTIYLGNLLTVTGKLSAIHDDLSEDDEDLLAWIRGATVKIYNGEILLGTCETDNKGEFSFNYTPLVTGALSLKAVYESTLYESGESSSTTVTVSELSIDDIILTSDKSILSYADGEYATLTAQLQNEGSNVAAANVSVDFNIYDWDDNLLDTIVGTTNASGVASVSYHAQHSGDIYIRANVTNVFSNNIQIQDYLFVPKLDGTDNIYQITGTTTVVNGVMSGGSAYFSNGWDNTIDWEMTADIKLDGYDGECIFIAIPITENKRDTNNLQIHSPYYHKLQYWENGSVGQMITLSNYSQNKWYSIKVIKQGITVILEMDNQTYNISWNLLSSLRKISCGVDSYGGTAHIKNIIVKSL